MVASSGMIVTTLAVEDADARILSVLPTPCLSVSTVVWIGIIASRSTVCRKIVRRTPASARGTADTEPTCDAGSVEQRQRSALCCRIDYSITGRGGFADIERTRSDGHCAGASAGSHRNVLSHDIARGALEGGLEPIVLATHGVDGEGGVVRDRIMT